MFDSSLEFVVSPLYLDDRFGCTYFRLVAQDGTQWQRNLIIQLEKEKQELKDEVLNLKRQIDDMVYRK